MSIFGSIKDAIFGHPAVQGGAQAGGGQQSGQGAAQAPQAPQAPAAPQAPQAPQAPAAPAEPKIVDPEAALQRIAQSKGNPNLDWQHSIVDLMKLIGMDPSLDNRKELATELGYTGEKNGSAEMNMWLHHAVMERIRTGK